MFGPVVSYGNVLTVVSLLASLVIATLVCGKSDAGPRVLLCGGGSRNCLHRPHPDHARLRVGLHRRGECFHGHLRGRGCLGGGCVILPARVTFAREFADETVGCVRLSQRTAAAALLLDLQDKEWEVPEHVREQAKRLEKRSKLAPAAATDPASRNDEE